VDQKELVEQCKRQVPKAERMVFELYAPMLRGVCFRYTDSADDVEDILQEGFIRIFDTIKTFEWKGEGSFTAWMRKVMVNNAINFYNKKRRLKIDYVESDSDFEIIISDKHDQDDSFGFEKILAMGITQQHLLALLMKLPEMYRITFNLAVIDGLKHKEIAEMLGVDESSSRSRLLRAKKMLKESLMVLINECKTKELLPVKEESVI